MNIIPHATNAKGATFPEQAIFSSRPLREASVMAFIEFKDITKRFPCVLVFDGADFSEAALMRPRAGVAAA